MGGHKSWNRDYDYGREYGLLEQIKFGAIPTSVWITLMFVLSLYLWPKHRQRDNPATIVRRIISITISTVVSIFIVYLYSRYHSNKSWTHLITSFKLRKLKIKDYVWPLIITATIFLGPIVDEFISGRLFRYIGSFSLNRNGVFKFITRNIIAPLIEEIVFRCINCTLLSNNFSFAGNVIISGLLFGAAHFHPQLMQHVFVDLEREFLADTIQQFFYTSAFGMYAATIFMKTKSLWPGVLVHIFCNVLGAPSSSIFRSGWLRAVTILGISLWLVLYTHYLQETSDINLID